MTKFANWVPKHEFESLYFNLIYYIKTKKLDISIKSYGAEDVMRRQNSRFLFVIRFAYDFALTLGFSSPLRNFISWGPH